MPNIKEKVHCKTELEFITMVADDCVVHLNEKERKHLISNPCAINYHFSYCLYIRNRYIHNKDFSDVNFWVEPDRLSGKIIRMIFAKLIPEYDYSNEFTVNLFDDSRFLKLRKEYKEIYGEYPISIIESYKVIDDYEEVIPMSEIHTLSDCEFENEMAVYRRNHERICKRIDLLVSDLAESVWRTEILRDTATECGIDFEMLIPKINEIKDILLKENEYIPLEVCLLPFKKSIGQKRYNAYRKQLCKVLSDNPSLMEKIDHSYFDDRIVAKAVLKYRWPLGLLPQYQDDEVMVKYSLSHDGEAIQYAAKRFQTNRDWVKYAIEHSKDGTIMCLDCMKQYRADKEFVYLACKIHRWNFIYVDESYRNDYELAKICMDQVGDPNNIYRYMSARLRDNKELALLDLQEDYPHVEYYSSKLRNDDEIAAELYRLHGPESWAWRYMSKWMKKKYKIEDK